jgi:tRNA A37 threonylcarbamoyladenosine synthetase subunit TsaC/SUA5/YrdC
MDDKRKIVGVRIPDSPLALALIEHLGRPMITSSVPMKRDGTPYHMGYEVFEDYGHGIDMLLDLGEDLPGLESSIIDFTQDYPEVVRAGAGDLSLIA